MSWELPTGKTFLCPKARGVLARCLYVLMRKNIFLTMFDKVKQAFVRDPDGYYLEFCRLFAKRALETSFSPNYILSYKFLKTFRRKPQCTYKQLSFSLQLQSS